jgi:plastocyanin
MAQDQRSRLVAIAGVLMVACSSAPTAPSPAATIRIGTSGVDPREVRIERGNYVMFVNADSRPHTIVSDPVDLHTQCPALNRVGVIPPGQSRESGSLTERTACGFHDHNDPADGALKGRILVE